MGLTREPDRLPGPLFSFSLGVLAARDVGDQTKSGHTKCVLVGRRRYFQCNVALPSARWQHCGHEVRPAGADRAIPACGLLLWFTMTRFSPLFLAAPAQ